MESARALPLLARRPRVLREFDLEWYWLDGQGIFECSSFGAVIERQAHFGQELQECERCGGSGFTTDDGTCRSCKGLGGRPRRLRARTRGRERAGRLLFGTIRCTACAGRVGLTDCTACRGAGWIDASPVGIQSTHEDPASYTPSEKALTKYAQISRWLTRTPTWGARVLEAYYGLDGYRWGATKWGRIMAVVPQTDEGRVMLAGVDNRFGLSAQLLLANVVDTIERISDAERALVERTKIAVCVRDATRLYGRACAVWNEAVEGAQK